jgi:hypothetical protein
MGMDSIFMVRTCWRGIRAADVRRGRRRRKVIIDGWGGGRTMQRATCWSGKGVFLESAK